MEIALATDDPYEVIEKSKEMNDVGCYFLDIQLEVISTVLKVVKFVSMTQLGISYSLQVIVS